MSEDIAARVHALACSVLGLAPEELGRRDALRDHCYGLYQLDLAEVLAGVEDEFGVSIETLDWQASSTPNWELCTVDSIAEIVQRRLYEGRRPPRKIAPTDSAASFRTAALQHAAAGRRGAAIEGLELALILLEGQPERSDGLLSTVLAELVGFYCDGDLFTRWTPSAHQAEIYERVVQLCARGAQQRDPELAEALSMLVQLELHAKRQERAAALADRALAAWTLVYGPGDPRLEASLFNRGVVALTGGDTARAGAAFAEALAVVEQGDGAATPLLAEALDRQGQAYLGVEAYDHAEHAFERAVRVLHQVNPGSREVAVALIRLAGVRMIRRDYTAARSVLLTAVQLRVDSVVSPERRAELERGLDDSLDAHDRVLYEAGIRDATAREALSQLAHAWHETGPPGMTRTSYERVVAIYEQVYGPEHHELATPLSNLGSFYSEFRQPERGAPLLERALRIHEHELAPDDPRLGPVLHNLAGTYRSLGRDAEAATLLRRCVAVRERAYGPAHESLAMLLRELAYASADAGSLAAAIDLLWRATEIEEPWFARVLALGSEEQKADFGRVLAGRCNATLSFHAQHAPRDARATWLALTALLRTKGRMGDAVTSAVDGLRRSGDPASLELLERWTGLLTAEAEWYVSQSTETALGRDREFDKLRVAREDLERAIARTAPQPPPATVVDAGAVQAVLARNAALVEFSRIEPIDLRHLGSMVSTEGTARYGAFVLRHERAPEWVDLGPAGVIEEMVGELRRAWGGREERWRVVARKLAELLLEPVGALAGAAHHLFMVPAGAIASVPFAALVDASGDYAILSYRFTYLTTGRDLLRARTSRRRSSPLILAGPDFDQVVKPDRRASIGHRLSLEPFPPLPHAVAEGEFVRHVLPGSTLWSGRYAAKHQLTRAHSPWLVHIASHGYWWPDMREDWLKRFHSFSGSALPSPLLRSGIALAGANRYVDGILTALEVSALDLTGTALVTLSGCETGLGEVDSAEGIYGLRRAVFVAGAEALVVSLFRTPDESCKRLMAGFYTRLASRRGRSEALRETQLELLAGAASQHPVHWAGFVLIGRPDVIEG